MLFHSCRRPSLQQRSWCVPDLMARWRYGWTRSTTNSLRPTKGATGKTYDAHCILLPFVARLSGALWNHSPWVSWGGTAPVHPYTIVGTNAISNLSRRRLTAMNHKGRFKGHASAMAATSLRDAVWRCPSCDHKSAFNGLIIPLWDCRGGHNPPGHLLTSHYDHFVLTVADSEQSKFFYANSDLRKGRAEIKMDVLEAMHASTDERFKPPTSGEFLEEQKTDQVGLQSEQSVGKPSSQFYLERDSSIVCRLKVDGPDSGSCRIKSERRCWSSITTLC